MRSLNWATSLSRFKFQWISSCRVFETSFEEFQLRFLVVTSENLYWWLFFVDRVLSPDSSYILRECHCVNSWDLLLFYGRLAWCFSHNMFWHHMRFVFELSLSWLEWNSFVDPNEEVKSFQCIRDQGWSFYIYLICCWHLGW